MNTDIVIDRIKLDLFRERLSELYRCKGAKRALASYHHLIDDMEICYDIFTAESLAAGSSRSIPRCMWVFLAVSAYHIGTMMQK